MRLKKVALKNFRNYADVSVDTDADLVLILGQNASGKTNFLESIYFLSRLRSFRVSDNLLVKKQEDYFKINGHLDKHNLEAMVQLVPKFVRQFKIDEIKTKKLNWKTFAVVLFLPNDLNLFELGPNLRRNFLNQALSQTNFSYALDIASLDHILKQRSALFKQIFENQADAASLEIWNQELAKVSVNIYKQRKQFVDFINKNIVETHQTISDFDSEIKIIFNSINIESENEFLDKLKTYEQAELRSGLNLFGPHRDDFIIEKNGQTNTENSSRGELRSQILALKLLQAKYLTENKLDIIILLDDVFSELDEIRRTKLVESLSGHQIFITTTEEHHLPKLKRDVKILEVANNIIKTA